MIQAFSYNHHVPAANSMLMKSYRKNLASPGCHNVNLSRDIGIASPNTIKASIISGVHEASIWAFEIGFIQ